MHGVTLLPQELARAKEGTGGFLPTNYRAPLVIYLGQISVRLDYICIVLAEERLRGRTHAQPLGQLLLAAHSYPRNLGSKALNVVLLLLEERLGNEHGHIYVFYAGLLEPAVKYALDVLPYSISVGTDDHASLDAGVVNEVGLLYNIGVPFRKILVHRGYLLNELFLRITCHNRLKFPSKIIYQHKLYTKSWILSSIFATLPQTF